MEDLNLRIKLRLLVILNRRTQPLRTAFTSDYATYQLVWMTLELKNALVPFQSTKDIIFASVKCQSAFLYLDNIVVFSKTVEQCRTHLQRVFALLRYAGVVLKSKEW